MLIAQNLRKQEFINPVPTFAVRVATTVNGTLASAFDNASVVDDVTLVTGDYILLKDQTTQSENGVYIVQASGAPVRHPSYDVHLELNDAAVSVTSGSRNAGLDYYQNNVLASLSSNQSWSRTANAQSFVVPDNVKQLIVDAIGGGGGGGSGGGNGTGLSGNGEGGAGGAGCLPITTIIDVVPGDTISIVVGCGGTGGDGQFPATDPGTDGGSTILTGTGFSYTFLGASGGNGGNTSVASASDGTPGIDTAYSPYSFIVGSGQGATVQNSAPFATAGASTIYATGGAAGVAASKGGAGGGGGASYGNGGAGGNGTGSGTTGNPGTSGGLGAGGGGGGGGGDALGTTSGGDGGHGGAGIVKLYWIE